MIDLASDERLGIMEIDEVAARIVAADLGAPGALADRIATLQPGGEEREQRIQINVDREDFIKGVPAVGPVPVEDGLALDAEAVRLLLGTIGKRRRRPIRPLSGAVDSFPERRAPGAGVGGGDGLLGATLTQPLRQVDEQLS